MKAYVFTKDKALVRDIQKGSGAEVIALSDPNLNLSDHPAALVLVDSLATRHSGLDVICKLSGRGIRSALVLRQPALAWVMAARACGAVAVVTLPINPAGLHELLDAAPVNQPEWRSVVQSEAPHSFVGSSSSLMECFQAAGAAAASDAMVLIAGESGTGKGLLAEIIHQHGPRAGGPFVVINCGAMDEALLANELFGRDSSLGGGPLVGQLARADSGTVVLDHLEELPATMARQLSRVLDEQQFTPLGSFDARPLRARVIATTSASIDPELMNRFSIRIAVPALRHHAEDIAPLAAYFLEQAAQTQHRKLDLDAEALSALRAYEWPGNVRQLKHAMERAAAFAEAGVVESRHLPPELFGRVAEMSAVDSSDTSLANAERRHIREVWRLTRGHISETADLLGIHRNTLRRKLEEYGILNQEMFDE